jgi:hypothetical protein
MSEGTENDYPVSAKFPAQQICCLARHAPGSLPALGNLGLRRLPAGCVGGAGLVGLPFLDRQL